jgi:hypothetical protein
MQVDAVGNIFSAKSTLGPKAKPNRGIVEAPVVNFKIFSRLTSPRLPAEK